MIDEAADDLVPLKEASAYCPKRVHYQTLRNWVRKGTRGIKLDSVWVGGREYTSRSALSRFFAGLSRKRQAPAVADAIERNRNRLVRETIRAEFGV